MPCACPPVLNDTPAGAGIPHIDAIVVVAEQSRHVVTDRPALTICLHPSVETIRNMEKTL